MSKFGSIGEVEKYVRTDEEEEGYSYDELVNVNPDEYSFLEKLIEYTIAGRLTWTHKKIPTITYYTYSLSDGYYIEINGLGLCFYHGKHLECYYQLKNKELEKDFQNSLFKQEIKSNEISFTSFTKKLNNDYINSLVP